LTQILTTRMDAHPSDSHTLSRYEQTGGYATLRRALAEMQPDQITAEVKASNLRGRGGANFPCGVKWGFLAPSEPRYLVINADESEPGTFKDRQLLERDPHQLLEGIIISSFAIGAHQAFVYVRGEYPRPARRMQRAVEEAYAAGYLGTDILGSGFDLDVTVHLGGGAYICGEETALLNSLEGRRGEPRLKPPFPAVEGLYAKPTIVNNVETISNIPWIVEHGGAAFDAIGPEGSRGTRLFSLSGHVRKPGNYEVVMGLSWRELIYDVGGGIRDGNALKAWLDPGRGLGALVRGGASRHTGDHRRRRRQPVDARLRCGRRHGRDHLRRAGRPAGGALLRPRVVRPVHPVPGGHHLDAAGVDPPGGRGGARHRPGPAARHQRQHQPRAGVAAVDDDDLPAGPLGGLADHLDRQVLQGRGRRARARGRVPPWLSTPAS
jgi:hypothetical protein